MKITSTILILLTCLSGVAQMSNNTIRVRKIADLPVVEMIRYSDIITEMDSVIIYENKGLKKN